jgi:hypothetical protein
MKQLYRALIQQTEEPDKGLSDNLNLLMQPYQPVITSGQHCSKAILYHNYQDPFGAIMNQSLLLYQCRESFASFVDLHLGRTARAVVVVDSFRRDDLISSHVFVDQACIYIGTAKPTRVRDGVVFSHES